MRIFIEVEVCGEKCLIIIIIVIFFLKVTFRPHPILQVSHSYILYHFKIRMNTRVRIFFRLGEVCLHMAAIIFKVKANTRLDFNQIICTSMSFV